MSIIGLLHLDSHEASVGEEADHLLTDTVHCQENLLSLTSAAATWLCPEVVKTHGYLHRLWHLLLLHH